MLISLMSSYNLRSLKQSPYLFIYYLFIILLPILGKVKCEAVVADVLDKGSIFAYFPRARETEYGH